MGAGMRESHTKLHIRKGSGGGKKDNIRGSIGQTKKKGGGGNRVGKRGNLCGDSWRLAFKVL